MGLGRTPWQTFREVTLPAVRPAIGAGSLLVALYVLADFGAVSLMQYDALTRAIYLQYRALFDRDPAAVLALVLVALTAIVLLLEGRTRRGTGFRASPGTARPPTRVPPGRWRWPALGFCGLVVGLFLVVPLAVLVYWTVEGGRDVELPWAAALRSLGAAGPCRAAAIAVLPVAFLAGRWRRPWTVARSAWRTPRMRSPAS